MPLPSQLTLAQSAFDLVSIHKFMFFGSMLFLSSFVFMLQLRLCLVLISNGFKVSRLKVTKSTAEMDLGLWVGCFMVGYFWHTSLGPKLNSFHDLKFPVPWFDDAIGYTGG